jgi:hypothetical protein
MLRAAEASLVWWRISGSWREEERAHYRCAMSHRAAGNRLAALVHGERCLAIVLAHPAENGSPEPGEVFFAHLALASIRRDAGDAPGGRDSRERAAAELPRIEDAGFRSYAAGELAKTA